MSHDYTIFLAQIAVRSAVVLAALVAGFRWLGKRQVGQMNLYDIVLVMLLANAVQNAMTMGKGEVSVGVISAGVLILLGRALTQLFLRSPGLERHLTGNPSILLSNGRILRDRLRSNGVSDEMLMAALRQHGLADPADAKMVVLEVDGSLSVIPRDK